VPVAKDEGSPYLSGDSGSVSLHSACVRTFRSAPNARLRHLSRSRALTCAATLVLTRRSNLKCRCGACNQETKSERVANVPIATLSLRTPSTGRRSHLCFLALAFGPLVIVSLVPLLSPPTSPEFLHLHRSPKDAISGVSGRHRAKNRYL